MVRGVPNTMPTGLTVRGRGRHLLSAPSAESDAEGNSKSKIRSPKKVRRCLNRARPRSGSKAPQAGSKLAGGANHRISANEIPEPRRGDRRRRQKIGRPSRDWTNPSCSTCGWHRPLMSDEPPVLKGAPSEVDRDLRARWVRLGSPRARAALVFVNALGDRVPPDLTPASRESVPAHAPNVPRRS